jgi:hypothetical protein
MIAYIFLEIHGERGAILAVVSGMGHGAMDLSNGE